MKDFDSVSIREVYNLIDEKMRWVNNSVQRVEDKVDSLGAGRISNLEKAVANLQGRMMIIPTIISIAISVFFFMIEYVLKPK